MLYEALSVIVGPFLIFTIVKMLRTIINDQTLKKNIAQNWYISVKRTDAVSFMKKILKDWLVLL